MSNTPLQDFGAFLGLILSLLAEVGKVARWWMCRFGTVGIRYLFYWPTLVGLFVPQLVMELNARQGEEIVPNPGDVACVHLVYATYVMLIVHAAASTIATLRGAQLHPWQVGNNWLEYLGWNQKLVRLVIEPAVYAAAALAVQSAAPSLSKYFYFAAFCVFLHNGMINFRDHQRTELQLASYLEGQDAAERFSRRIGG